MRAYPICRCENSLEQLVPMLEGWLEGLTRAARATHVKQIQLIEMLNPLSVDRNLARETQEPCGDAKPPKCDAGRRQPDAIVSLHSPDPLELRRS
jgi:hypothetical protein